MPRTTRNREPSHKLQCSEVWGGVHAADTRVQVPGLEVAVYSQPYGYGVGGGDVHYASLCQSGRLARFVIADVAGHGPAVMRLGEHLKDLLADNINTFDQTDIARQVNEDLGDLDRKGLFATAILASLEDGRLAVVNAGHPRPLMYSQSSNSWRLLDPDDEDCYKRVANLPLGVVPGTDYVQFAVRMNEGDAVVLYTDSMIEAENDLGRPLGEDGLVSVVSKLNPAKPQQLIRSLMVSVADYRRQLAPHDDVTVIAVRRLPAKAKEKGKSKGKAGSSKGRYQADS